MSNIQINIVIISKINICCGYPQENKLCFYEGNKKSYLVENDLLVARSSTCDPCKTEMSHLPTKFYTHCMFVFTTCANTAVHTSINVQSQTEWVATVTSWDKWKWAWNKEILQPLPLSWLIQKINGIFLVFPRKQDLTLVETCFLGKQLKFFSMSSPDNVTQSAMRQKPHVLSHP